IRYDLVTGVQTCALPIYRRGDRADGRIPHLEGRGRDHGDAPMIDSITFDAAHAATLARFWCEVLPDYEIAPYTDEDMAQLRAKRSEERRVGKEGRRGGAR